MQTDKLPILDFGTYKEYVDSGTKLSDITRTMAKIYLIDTVTENKITDPDFELRNARTYTVITELDEMQEKINQLNNRIKELEKRKKTLATSVKKEPARRLHKSNTFTSLKNDDVKEGNSINNSKLELISSKDKKSKKEFSEKRTLVNLFLQEEKDYSSNIRKIKELKDKLLERKIIEQEEINTIFSLIESIGKASSILIRCIREEVEQNNQDPNFGKVFLSLLTDATFFPYKQIISEKNIRTNKLNQFRNSNKEFNAICKKYNFSDFSIVLKHIERYIHYTQKMIKLSSGNSMELQSLENMNEILNDLKDTVDIEVSKVFSSIKNVNDFNKFLDVTNPDRWLKFEIKTKVKLPHHKPSTLTIFCFDDCIIFASEKSGIFSKNPRYFILKSYFFMKDVTSTHVQDNSIIIHVKILGEFAAYQISDLSEEQCNSWDNFINSQKQSNSTSTPRTSTSSNSLDAPSPLKRSSSHNPQ